MPVFAESGPCENPFTNNRHSGFTLQPPAAFTNVRGVRALVTGQERTIYCTGGTDPTRGPSYWVSIEPGPGNAHYNSVNSILQIGVIRCTNILYDACHGGLPRLFWARGGCNQNLPFPNDLGPAPSGAITFAVRHVGNGSYLLTGVQNGVTIAVRSVLGDDPYTSCWASGSGDITQGGFYCERLDDGDSCGNATSKLTFATIRYQRSVEGSWYAPGNTTGGYPALTDSQCYEETSEDNCDMDLADRMRLWTVQN